MPDLKSFFSPTSIAVVGGSERVTSLGATVLQNLKSSGFKNPVYAVNLKKYDRVFDFPCVRYLQNIPITIDLVVCCVPMESVGSLLNQMQRLNIKAALILTGGLSQRHYVDSDQILKITQLAKIHGIRVMGPHALGVIVPGSFLNASYAHLQAKLGSVAYIGHSAAMGSALLDWANRREIGFSHFLTLGDSADLTISDVVDYLASDRRVKSILIHLEKIRDANKLLVALRAAAKSKKVLALRTYNEARTDNGMSDTWQIDEEYFLRAGVLQVNTIDQLFSGLEIISRSRPLYRPNLAIVSNGHGTALLAKQYLLSRGGHLAPLSVTESLDRLIQRGEENSRNPAILPSNASGSDYVSVLQTLESQAELGSILIIHSPSTHSLSKTIYPELLKYVKRSRRQVLTCFLGGHTTQEALHAFDEAGLLNFDSPTEAVNAFLTLAKHAEAQERLRETPTSDVLNFQPDKAKARQLIAQAHRSHRSYLTWPETRQLLRAYNFHLVDSTFDSQFETLLTHLTPRFFPASLRIVHEAYSRPFAYQHNPAARWRATKIELSDEAALKEAYDELVTEKNHHLPESKVLGWAVQPMRRKIDALQFSLGITRDSTYGPLVFFGEGGSHIDMLTDRHIALPPLNSALAKQLIEKTRGYQILVERSHSIDQDVSQLVGHLLSLSQMVIDNPRLEGVEINLLLQNNALPLVIGVAASLGKKIRPALNPYPSELEEMATLRTNRDVIMRPIRGEDEPMLARFYSRLDSESLRLRFFSSRLKFEHVELVTLCQIDYWREMVFIAIENNEILGEMRLWLDVNRQVLEFAVMVDLDVRQSGLANLLMEKAIRYGQSIRTKALVADILPENTAMLALAEHFKFQIDQQDDSLKAIKYL